MRLVIILLGLIICAVSCSDNYSNQDIRLEVVRQTSDAINCTMIYGYSEKKLTEQNEILIQTGILDTTDEHPPIEVAIVKINNKEILLSLSKYNQFNEVLRHEYLGEGYHLSISVTKEKDGDTDIYKGKCTIAKDSLKSEYKVIGRDNKIAL